MKLNSLVTIIGIIIIVLAAAAVRPGAAAELHAVAIATNASGQTGYLAALIEAKGISKGHGLKINNMMMDFTEAANALRLGRALASTMQPSTAVNLRKTGTDVRLLAPQLWSGNVFLVRKEAPYKKLADLKNKKIGNFSRTTGAYFFSAVIAKENGLDIEKDFQTVQGEMAAMMAWLERGEVEAINLQEPHVTRMLVSGRYRVLLDFDGELLRIFGAQPLKTGVAVLKETADKQPQLLKAIRAAYSDGIKTIKTGQDKEFFENNAKELFGLRTPEEIAAGFKRNRESYADAWGDKFFEAQNRILQQGIALGLLPSTGNLNELWIK
jgi:ABC-type nitrate/sulfonate/bicarbonate transport system substrate-binding protein